MTYKSYPWKHTQESEQDWEHLARQWQDTGVDSYPGTSVCRVDGGAGMTVVVNPGVCKVRGWSMEVTADHSLPIDANPSSFPRIDLVVARRSFGNGVTLPDVAPTVVKGSPASTPAVPTAQQVDGGTFDLPLAQVRVPAGAGTSGNAVQSIQASFITDKRDFVGLRCKPCTSANRPEISPRPGQLIFETDTGRLYIWNSLLSPPGWDVVYDQRFWYSTWRTLPLISGRAAYNGRPPEYRRNGSVIELRGQFAKADGTAWIDKTFIISAGTLPSGWRPPSLVYGTVPIEHHAANPTNTARAEISTAGLVSVWLPQPADDIHWIGLDGLSFALDI